MVDWPAAVLCEAVMAPEPAKTSVPLETVPVLPNVLPVLLTPAATPAAGVGPMIVTVPPLPESVILAPPLKNSVFVLEALKVVVPAVFPARVIAWKAVTWLCVDSLKLAVICELPDIPNVKLLLFARPGVPEVAVCVPAEKPSGHAVCACVDSEKLAVIWLLPDIPKVKLLLLASPGVPLVAVCVPAENACGHAVWA